MYGISKTKYDTENLEKLPYFNKNTAGILLGKEGRNLDRLIERLIKSGYFLRLKNGLYTTRIYLLTVNNKEEYAQSLVPVLYYPSYLSGEYVLSKYGLIPEAIRVFTSTTSKTTRQYKNFLGRFSYQNISLKLFLGFINGKASKAKAIFDFLYLKTNLGDNLTQEITEGLRINWDSFNNSDFKEFKKYVKLSGSIKMIKIMKIIGEIKK